MENFVFQSPTKFVFGKDTEADVGELLASYGTGKVLIHYGGGSVVRSGLLDRVRKSISDAGIAFVELGGVEPNPKDTKVYEGISLCREENVDFILAVGGGSSIDSAKAIAIGVPYDGDFWDFYAGKAHAVKTLPVATILTIAAAGSEGSESSVITKVEGSLKRGYSEELLRPVFSILNPALTQTLPANQTAAGSADIMAHIFERYFTNSKEVEVTDRLCEALLMTMLREVPIVLRDPNNYEARANIMWAGMVAHNNIIGVGREQDWSSHAIEHELSALYGIAHGAGLAVIFPAWMKFVMEHDIMRFAQLATRVFGCNMDYAHPENTAREGIAKLEETFKSWGLPVRMVEFGGVEEDIPYLASHIGIGDGTLGSFVKLSVKDVESIYRIALR
jgi:alcohol dehydrogenase YqhD (iron-dependent ADH family)